MWCLTGCVFQKWLQKFSPVLSPVLPTKWLLTSSIERSGLCSLLGIHLCHGYGASDAMGLWRQDSRRLCNFYLFLLSYVLLEPSRHKARMLPKSAETHAEGGLCSLAYSPAGLPVDMHHQCDGRVSEPLESRFTSLSQATQPKWHGAGASYKRHAQPTLQCCEQNRGK